MIEVDPMSIDQLAGAVVLFLGSVGSLLLVVWQSKCHCKVNLCYIFQCERRPPNEEEMKSLKDQTKKLKDMKKKEEKEKLDEVEQEAQGTPRLIPKTKSKDNILPYPDDDIDKLV